MARHNELVFGISVHDVFDGCPDINPDLGPGFPETLVNLALAAEIRVDFVDHIICSPIGMGNRPAEGQDNDLVEMIDGKESSIVERYRVLEFGQRDGIGRFHHRTATCGASDGSFWRIVIAFAVCRGGILGEEAKVIHYFVGHTPLDLMRNLVAGVCHRNAGGKQQEELQEGVTGESHSDQ